MVAESAVSTVSEIGAGARRVAEAVAAQDADPHRPVGLAAPNGAGFLAGYLGLRLARRVALLIDWQTPPGERQRILEDLSATGVLESAAAEPLDCRAWQLRRVESEPMDQALNSVAAIQLSSGSSGRARGVAVSTEALIADDRALTSSMGLSGSDAFLAAVPFSHSYGFASLVLPALLRGSRLVVPSVGGGPFAPLAAARWGEATVFPTAPSFVTALTKTSREEPLPPSVRRWISAGAPLGPEIAQRFRERWNQAVHVFYGATECGGIAYDREGTAAERGTLGTPIDGVRIELKGPANGGEEEADKGAGQVVVHTPAAGCTYLPLPDESLQGGTFQTDDLATWTNGELRLVGRLGDVLNVRGKKVHPQEVERVLSELEGVEEAVVLPGSTGDDQEARVLAVVAPQPRRELVAGAILKQCRAQLAPHKVPRQLLIVDQIPRSARGKIDRQAVQALVDQRTSRLSPDLPGTRGRS